MSNQIITERMIQYRLAELLGWPVILPQIKRFYDVTRDEDMILLRANDRKVRIHVPFSDLTLPMVEFDERYLQLAAQALTQG